MPEPALDPTGSATPAHTDAPVDILAARIYDAALGELTPEEIAALQTELAAQPDGDRLQRQLQKAGAALQELQQHPRLQAHEPRESWRVQTLHKAKVEAAKLRQQRKSNSQPVARPALSHRQLAGLSPLSIAHPGEPPPAPKTPSSIRPLFLLLILCGVAGVLVILLVGVRLLQTAASGSPQNQPGSTQIPVPGPGAGPATVKSLTVQDQLKLQARYPGFHQLLQTQTQTVTIELGGTVTEKVWARSGAEVPDGIDRYLYPVSSATWDRIDLEGDLADVTLVYLPDDPRGLQLYLRPAAHALTAAGGGTSSTAAKGGWQLELRKNITQMGLYEVPPPSGLAARALAIERGTVGTGEEQVRFLAVGFRPRNANEGEPSPRGWEVLSDRLLPVHIGPGRWALDLPKGRELPPLTYIIQAVIARDDLAH